MTDSTDSRPENDPGPKPDPAAEKMQQLADEAIAAGKRFLESDSGKKLGELAETGFAKAEALISEAIASDLGQQAKQALDKAVASEPAQQVKGVAADLTDKAPEPVKQAVGNALGTALGRNVAIGAGVGLAASFVIPFIGPLIGVAMGGGLGYLRTITRKD
jgi:hypothetical protein